MIDATKEYTYNGKPVRIYADGSDTTEHLIHVGIQLPNGLWSVDCYKESDLVEVWQPVIGEWVYTWDDDHIGVSVQRYGKAIMCNHIAKFTGTLPEAFKGL